MSYRIEAKELQWLTRFTSWITFWRRSRNTLMDNKRHTSYKNILKNLFSIKGGNLTLDTTWWLAAFTESWEPIGSERAISGLLQNSTILKMWEMKWYISQTTPFKNIVKAMESTKKETKCLTMNSRDTWIRLLERESLVSARVSIQKWKLLPLMPSKRPIWKWTPTKLNTIFKFLD